jgi:D-methionine transport system substrate-binding protein
MKRLAITAKVTALAAAAVLALSACAGGAGASESATGESPNDPIRIGIVNADDPYRSVFQAAAQAEGIYIEFVNFSEFPLVNQALAEGDLDMNQFQHLQFLANFNVATGNNLVPIGATAVYPLGLYSFRHDSVADFPEGAIIAIPNDPTNQARALLVLQDAGLITLRDGGNSFSTPFDIIAAESRATVIPVEAAMTAVSLSDVDGSIVNNSMIAQIGMGLQDAIFADDPDSPAAEPYINIFVTRPEDANNPVFHRLVEIFHGSPEVIAGLIDSSAGTAAVRNNDAADLQRILAEIEANLANN